MLLLIAPKISQPCQNPFEVDNVSVSFIEAKETSVAAVLAVVFNHSWKVFMHF